MSKSIKCYRVANPASTIDENYFEDKESLCFDPTIKLNVNSHSHGRYIKAMEKHLQEHESDTEDFELYYLSFIYIAYGIG